MEIKIPTSTFWKGKKVLITGHTGFKGSWLCMLLDYLGAEVHGYALKPSTEPALYSLCKCDNFVSSHINDIRDINILKDVLNKIQPEIVIHMAAQALVRYSYQNPVETFEINIMGTINLLESVRQTSSVKALINVTTDKCYENKEWIWPYREHDPMGGYDPYSASKACSELVTASYRRSFFNGDGSNIQTAVATARAGNVIGGGDWASDRLIPDFLRAILKEEEIVIRNPKAIRPWQHVLEPLSGYLVLAEALYNKGYHFADSWNFGPNDEDAKDVESIVKLMCEKWGNRAKYVIDKKPQPHEANYLKLDCSKAHQLLGWYPQWNINKTLGSIIAFNKAYLKNEDVREVCYFQIKEYLGRK